MRTIVVLALLATCAYSRSVRGPLFSVRERQRKPANVTCPIGLLMVNLLYSELTVFHDGQVTQVSWVMPACSHPADAWGWTPPAGSKVRRFTLRRGYYEGLQRFLDGPKVKALRSFMNAGGGVGDYEIEIHRLSGLQTVSVVSLLPNHDELRRNPTLLRVICRAKDIAGDEHPGWCPTSPARYP
jgi:hypothetical protein